MCGIFGAVVQVNESWTPSLVKRIISSLADEAQSRGKDSSGLAIRENENRTLRVYKGNMRIDRLLENTAVIHAIDSQLQMSQTHDGGLFACMGHSRLVTNGSQLQDVNNQPVTKDGVVGIHNGIITNDRAVWDARPDLSREYEIDTEILLALIGGELKKGTRISGAFAHVNQAIEGTYSVALMFAGLPVLALATNNGSLYYLTNQTNIFVFASEEYALSQVRGFMPSEIRDSLAIGQVRIDACVVVSLDTFSVDVAIIGDKEKGSTLSSSERSGDASGYSVHTTALEGGNPSQQLVLDTAELAKAPAAARESKLLEYNLERIRKLRRCTRCILPETFPFISFDAQGVCNYCHGYRIKNNPKPFAELETLVEPYRRGDGKAEVIVPFSGGRDSTFGLHVIKNKLKLKPIAFTYDWGMVTDLGRRNIARVCGRMGVENIIVAADIHWKRANIRKNIKAWLKRPELGMIPLFMAGDKYFYYYVDKVKKQTGINLNIWGVNPLENTDFKVGFLGVPPDFEKKRIYSLSMSRQLNLFAGVGTMLLRNPSYVNGSVWDTMGSFLSRSIKPHTHYHHLYDYIRWDETEINKVLFDVYDWERAVDTDTTWRIGDGTAAFYNYIYCTVAGFSEHDTFRSNQIREGQISRHEALALAERDNQPRYPTIKWYLEIVGLEFEPVIDIVNKIPRLYA